MHVGPRDYSKLLATLRDTKLMLDESTSEGRNPASLEPLKQALAESIAQLETLSGLAASIEQIRRML